jgi:hypothetical protein
VERLCERERRHVISLVCTSVKPKGGNSLAHRAITN